MQLSNDDRSRSDLGTAVFDNVSDQAVIVADYVLVQPAGGQNMTCRWTDFYEVLEDRLEPLDLHLPRFLLRSPLTQTEIEALHQKSLIR